MDRIYVQIPAYRDEELASTLRDLYAKAAEPQRLRVRVVWQHAADETVPPAVRRLPGLEFDLVPYAQSRGCNWARQRLQKAWRGEPYTLLLDSHHRFVRGWDVKLLGLYEALRQSGVEKPLITGYLPPYVPEREPGGRRKRPYKIYPLSREAGLLTKLTSYPIHRWTSLEGPVPADFLSLHLVFTQGAFNREVPFDPNIYFFGDEVVTGARAFTCGYDLYHPHVVIGWHCYDRRTRVPHWNDHPTWHRQHRRSLERMRRLLLGRGRNRYGLGRQRTLAQYEDHILLRLMDPS